ncbi:hypothetical protein [Oceanobacillus bengalensis]|uniref:Heme ABC transporter n=1 Tax=Oceanobacillus bengalensis TaxID=1435466 RepID=A0A494Z313_9BACI|nr:hypothetical protein [Oceanobacillus bengalensis]RKQ16822.1 hypothetical protein D8M05_06100 [Oceanobacillus bengalensis]
MSNKNGEKINGNANNIEVWEDIVSVKDLLFSIIICLVSTMLAYSIAPDDSSSGMLYGIIGAVVGFVICSIIFKPKRKLTIIDEEK